MSRLDELKKKSTNVKSRLETLKSQSRTAKVFEESDVNKFISDYENFMKSEYNDDEASELKRRLTDIRVQYDLNRQGLSEEESELDSYLNKVKYSIVNRKNPSYESGNYDEIKSAEDFYDKSGYVSTKSDKWWSGLTSQYGMRYDDLTYEYINNQDGLRDEIKSKYITYTRDNANAENESDYEQKGYDFLSKDEIAVYNYYYATEGKDKAQEFLDSIESDLIERKAGKTYEALEGETLKEIFYGVITGADSYRQGVENIGAYVTGDEGFTSAEQVVGEKVREDLADNGFKILGNSVGQIAYDLTNTTAHMLPSMAIGAATGGLGGALSIGASSVGNSYTDMRRQGYSADQARAYGALVGASEATLQYALGGISKLGGKLTNGAVSKFVSGLDNALAKTAIQLGGSMASEGLEESIQTVLEPAFKALVTGEEYEAAEWEDIIYSGLLGSLSAGVLEGPVTVKSGVKTALNDRTIGKLYGNQSQQIIDDALSVQNNSELQSLAEKYKGRVDKGKNLKGSQINRLIDATDAAKLKNSTLQRLGELGETSDVTAVAEVLTKYAMGEELTSKDWSVLNDSKAGHTVLAEMNKDNIKSGILGNKWAENIGTRRINPETYNKALYDLAKAQAGVREATEQSAVDKSKADFANATGDKFKLSENGNTKYKDADVTIGKVASTKGGLKVELDNGETVNASDIEFGTGAEAMMYEMVARMEVPVSTANEMLNAFKPTTTKQATMYFHNIPLAYKYGTINYEAGLRNINMSDSEKKLVFTRGRMDAIEKAKSNTKITSKANQTTSAKKNGIIYEDGFTYDEASAKKLQKVSMAGIETIAQMSSLEVHVFRSKVENGKRVAYVNGKLVSAPNGYFTDGNKIYIDFESGNGGEGAMLYTMSHEVTHYIRKWNEKGFKELGDFLIEQYAKNKVSVTNLIEEQKTKIENRYEREGKALPSDAKLFDMAYEELVADAMSDMLTDPRVYEKLAKLKQKNKILWQKVGEAIKAVLDKLKSALGIYKTEQNKIAVAQEAHEVRAFTADVYEKLQDLYIKAFVQADANYESAKATGFAKDYLETKDIAYNLRATESHKKKLEEQYSKDASIDLETLTQRYNKIIDIWESLGGELNSKFLNEWNNKVGKDRAFTVFKAQAGYKYNVELSSMCKKGVPLFEAIDTIVKEEVMQQLDTKVLGKAEKEILYDLLKSHNFEIPCAICYVEQARQREGAIIDSFLNGKIEKNKSGKITQFKLGWNEVLQAVQKEMKTNGVDYTFSKVDRSIATDKYAPVDTTMDATTQEAFYNALKKIANKEITRYNKAENKSRKLVTNVTPSAIKEVFKGTLPSNLKIFKVLFNDPSSRFMLESDLLYSSMTTTNLATAHNELYSLFNSQGGVSGYKTKQGAVVYWGDILGKSWKPSTVRDEGGIRNQSNSDFQMYTLLDQVQMYIDFTAKGYYLQAYTKVLSELKLFGLSRGKINASLIPAVYEYRNADGTVDVETTRANAGLDKNGNLLFDDIEGINHNEAFMLLEDAEYSKSIGGICIGYSDAHILKLLDDKRVQQIIGFHDKTDDPDKRYRGARYAKNYNGLNEAVKIDNDGNPKTIHIGFNPYVRKAEKKFTLNSKTEMYEGSVVFNGKTYEADDIPKLAADMYLDMCAEKGYAPAYEDFASHENYYKLLADFSLYDSQGHYAPHRKVAYNMPDTVPFLDINGKKQYMPTKDYIKAELEKELKVRDSISEALADKSENGLIPQFVKKVNELHQDQSETKLSDRSSESGKLEERDYTVSEIKDLFNRWNTDNDLASLGERVFAKLENLIKKQREQGDKERHYLFQYATRPYTIRVTNADYIRKRAWVNRGVGVFSDDRGSGLYGITFDSEGLAALDDQTKAQVLLHEAIHAITVKAIDDVKKEIPKDTPLYTDFIAPSNWSEEQKGALALLQIFQQVGFSGYLEKKVHYGEESVYEMVAELSNPEFRQFLKKKSLWSRVVDAIKRILGIGGNNALDATSSALERILDDGVTTSDLDIRYSDRVVDLSDDSELSTLVNGVHGARRYKAIAEYILNVVEGGSIVFNDGLEAIVDKRDAAHIAHGAGKHKVNQIAKIKDLINQAVVYAEENDVDHNKFNHFLYYESIVKYDGEVFPLYLNVGKGINDGKYHLYDITKKIRDTANRINGLERPKPNEGYAQENDISTNNISQKTKIVNSKFSERDPNAVSNRTLLANALESVAQNDIEKNKLAQYKAKIALIESEQKKLAEIRAKANELRFTKGRTPADTKTMRNLDAEANQIANRISTWDKQLLNLESTTAIKNVLEREKALLRKRLEQKGKEALKAQKQKDAATVRELMNRHTESRKKAIERRHKSEIRGKIKKFKEQMQHSLEHPTDRVYIPAKLAQAIIDICDLINTDTPLYKADGSLNMSQEKRNQTKERLLRLRVEYDNLKNDPDALLAQEYEEAISKYFEKLRTTYDGKSLSEMSLDELEEMYSILKSIDSTLKEARKTIGWADVQDIYEAGDAIVREQAEIEKSRKNGKRSAGQKTKDAVIDLTLSPVRNVERMTGYKEGSFLTKLFHEFERGVRAKNLFAMRAYRLFEALTQGKEYDDAIYKAYGETYTDSYGRQFNVSKMQMMQTILSHEREEANEMTHIENGGFTFADLKLLNKGKLKDAISEENSHRVEAGVALKMVFDFKQALANDKWAQDYMEASRKFFDGMAKDAVNETYLALKHRIIARDKNYIPFETDTNFVVREISAQNDIQQTINSYGMLQETKKGASQPLIISGLNNIVDRHIEQVGSIQGLAIPIRNFNKVWNVRAVETGFGNDPTVKGAIEHNWGTGGTQLITQTVQDLQGARPNNQSWIYRKVKSGYITSKFVLNLSVVLKQMGSLFTSTSMLKWRNPVSMMGNFVYTMFNSKKIAAEVDKYTASVWMRRQGLSDSELHTLMTEAKKPGIFKLLQKTPTAINPTKWITAMDSVVALSLWKYAKEDTAARTGLQGEELLKATAEFYDSVIENTQSMSDVLHRPEIQKRGDIISESFAMFKTDLYQGAGQLQTVLGRYKANKTKENGAALAKTVYGITASMIWGSLIVTSLIAMLRYKVNPYRDDEDEDITLESWLKRLSLGFGGELLGYIFPLAGGEFADIVENIMYGESTDDAVDSLALTAINDLISTMSSIGANLKEGEAPTAEEWQKLLTKSLEVFGIPATNVTRTVNAVKLHAKDIANGEFLSFEAGAERTAAHHIHRIVEALESGKTDVADGLFNDAVETLTEDKDEAMSKLKSALGKKYKEGEVSKDTAAEMLEKFFDLTDDDIYWQFDKWDYATENGTSDGYAKYDDLVEALESGQNIQAVISEYKSHGVEAKTLKAQVTEHYKPLYKQAYQSGDSTEMLRIRRILLSSGLYGTASDVVKTAKDWLKS